MKPFLLSLLLSCVFGALDVPAKTIADWQFEVPAGTEPNAIADTAGQVKFDGSVAGVTVTDGVLRARRSMPGLAALHAPLPVLPREQELWLVAELSDWHFTGKPGEYVSFGFVEQPPPTDVSLSPEESIEPVLAEARLLRTRPERANINGRAGGLGGTTGLDVGPGLRVPLVEKKTTFIALRYDPATHTYTALSKQEGGAWKFAGHGATDIRRRPKFVRLAFFNVMNDTAEEGAGIRRLTVATTPPADLPPDVLPDLPFITAPAWAVCDAATGEIIGGKEVDTPAKIASINKTMTAHLVCKLAAKDPKVLDEIITCTPASEAVGGSSSGLPAGDRLTVRDALYALMLPSSNDIGVLFAEHFAPRFAPPETPLPSYIPAARAHFIAEMNREAKALGMKSTTYRSPFGDGGTANDRTSTPRDLLLLARAAMQNELFREVVGTTHHQATVNKPDGSTRTIEWKNSNFLLGTNGITGIKTGTTVSAKACLLSSREVDGRGFFAVVLGTEPAGRRFVDTMNIYRWAARQKPAQPKASAHDYDVILRNGTLIDGTGAPGRVADLAIKDGRIAAIGKVRGGAASVVDAKGLAVAPGFIDVHSHADRNLGSRPTGINYLRMGVTTVVTGNCGGSPVNIAETFAKYEKNGIGLNTAILIGHNSVRRKAMDGSFNRPPTPEELDQMKALVDQAMKDGAVGLSTGLWYVPGTYSDSEEVVELAKVAAAHGGIYASHMRDESTKIRDSLDELFRVAREAKIPAHVSHIKLWGASSWNQADEILGLIGKARAEGLRITQDQYVYTAASTGVSVYIPSWSRESGPESFETKLANPEFKEKVIAGMKDILKLEGFPDYSHVVIVSFGDDPALSGLNIKQAALKLRGADALEDQIEILLDLHQKGGASGVFHCMNEKDLQRFLSDPHTMLAADASVRQSALSPSMPHPRGAGNNARLLGRYVRELKVLTLEDAVRRMTSLPAQTFGIKNRGALKKGAWADVVVFDPATVADHATFENPQPFATGFKHVFVNGVEAVTADNLTEARAGRVIRHNAD